MQKQHIILSQTDEQKLIDMLSKGSLKVRKQKRILGLLELHKGKTLGSVAETLGVSYQIVSSWRDSYNTSGLSFLDEKPRSGRPVGISGELRAQITVLACSEQPEGYAKWSLRLLANKLVELDICERISHSSIDRILKKTKSNHT